MNAPFSVTDGPGRWLTLADGGQTVWVNLDRVRQVLFCDDDGAATALLWCGDDLWEIADPAGLDALRRYLQSRALMTGVGE